MITIDTHEMSKQQALTFITMELCNAQDGICHKICQNNRREKLKSNKQTNKMKPHGTHAHATALTVHIRNVFFFTSIQLHIKWILMYSTYCQANHIHAFMA